MKYLIAALLFVSITSNSYASFYKSWKVESYQVVYSDIDSQLLEEQKINKLEAIIDQLRGKIKVIRSQRGFIMHPRPIYMPKLNK